MKKIVANSSYILPVMLLKKILSIARITFLVVSSVLLLIVLFSFTTGPYWIYHWLGTSESEFKFKPDYIIIMGGAGYPSESALMRSWYAAGVYQKNPQAIVVVTQPAAACVRPELSDAYGIRKDLIIRGVDSTRILLEIKGKNTREEGMNVLTLAPDAKEKNCVIITSPEHMRRSVLVFRKLGYKKVGGIPTFNASGPVDLDYKDSQLGGNTMPLPEVGGSIQLRYQFWNHLRYQVICYREIIGLGWYKLRGWV
jgi:uncharacterized SAM-binding protein YcdF (DUF218 family)